MATRNETRKKVEPRRSLWWSGIAKGSFKAATAAAAGQPAAGLVPSGRLGRTRGRPANAERQYGLPSRARYAGEAYPGHLGADRAAGAMPRRRAAGGQGPTGRFSPPRGPRLGHGATTIPPVAPSSLPTVQPPHVDVPHQVVEDRSRPTSGRRPSRPRRRSVTVSRRRRGIGELGVAAEKLTSSRRPLGGVCRRRRGEPAGAPGEGDRDFAPAPS